MKILDATGKGYGSKVDVTNRLSTRAVTEEGWVEAVIEGDHYALTSGVVTLTAATASAMMWIQNDGDAALLVDRIILNTDDSTGGTLDQFIFNIVKNATAMASGSGNPITQVNTNWGSNKTLTLSSEIGQEAATLTGGTVVAGWRIENPTRHRVMNVRFYIPKGTSVGFLITPPASNTSMAAVVAINAHKVIVE